MPKIAAPKEPKWKLPMTVAQKADRVSQTVRTRSGQTLRLTLTSEPVGLTRDEFPALRAHLAKMAEVTNA